MSSDPLGGLGQVRPFWLALAASIIFHLMLLLLPGWQLSANEETLETDLKATILVTAKPVSITPETIRSVPAKQPRRIARPRPPAVLPVSPQVSDMLLTKNPELEMQAAGDENVDNDVPMDAAAESEKTDSEAPENEQRSSASTIPDEDLTAKTDTSGAAQPASSLLHADLWPKRARIVFQVTRGENGFIVGRSEHNWQHDGKRYTLRALTETTGLAALFKSAQVLQESRGVFFAAGIQPHEFRNERTGKPVDLVRFDAVNRSIQFGTGKTSSFEDGVQDMLSVYYQSGVLSLDNGQQVLVKIATGRKLADYFVMAGTATELETPLGPRRARHVRVVPVQGDAISNDTFEIWIDDLLRLPLKIRYRDRKGEIFDQVVMEIETETEMSH